jgi:rfaE bifunctional protein nucleotidyltransferase chain/domain
MGIHPTKEKIMSWKELEARLLLWRLKDEKIVFSNGCFDIIHRGHVEYLERAKQEGSKLVIGLNSDDSVRRMNKGPGSPFYDQESRAIVISALQFVDAVALFDEDTPLELIKLVKPDVLVKGADYDPETVVGADFLKTYGGIVKTVPLTEGFSTSALVRRIRANQ